MDVTTFLQFFINGIVLGAIYVLLAIGLSIIFGMIGIVNLTHGILYMLGAYATVTLAPYVGFFPSLILSPLLVALFGMAIEAAFLRRIYKGDPALGLLFTFGLAMFSSRRSASSGAPRAFPSRFPTPCVGPSAWAPSSTRSTATSSGSARSSSSPASGSSSRRRAMGRSSGPAAATPTWSECWALA
jgi:branched-subunit amino acid ABC-type transport system permease component